MNIVNLVSSGQERHESRPLHATLNHAPVNLGIPVESGQRAVGIDSEHSRADTGMSIIAPLP
jgi:hypothetical protein